MTADPVKGIGSRSSHAHWLWATLAVLLALACQTLIVYASYSGHWSGLFRAGSAMRVPEDLASTAFRNPHPRGYDGQFFRSLAHDPFLRHGTAASLDSPVLRSRRILIPLMAWGLALGQPAVIDCA